MGVQDTEFPAQALQMLQAERYDLAIVDMHMPAMDGAMLAQKIREAGHSLPLVLFSSHGRKEASDSLFAATLAKPLRQSQLFDTLVQLLGHEEAPRPAAAAAKPRMDAQMAERHPLRILLAEDNVVNQKLALRILQQMGYRADVASNGVEAIEVLRAPALRRGADGRADAGDGRAGGQPPHRRALALPRPAPAHRRHDRQCHAGRPRGMHRCRHGRLRHQADPGGRAGGRAGECAPEEGPLR